MAHNKAVELCNTELFVCVDSDDILTNNAVEIIINYWKNDRNKNVDFVAYCLRKGDLLGNPTGKRWIDDERKISLWICNIPLSSRIFIFKFVKKMRWIARYKGWIKAFKLDKSLIENELKKMNLNKTNVIINLLSDIYALSYKNKYNKKRIKYKK